MRIFISQGLIMVILVTVLVSLSALASLKYGDVGQFDTFSWGFIMGMLLVGGLFTLDNGFWIGKEK